MFKKLFFGVFLFALTAFPAFAQTEFFSMPLTLFNEKASSLDSSSPYIHPPLPEGESKGDYIYFSVQEPDGMLRVAGYDPETGFRFKRRDFMNDGGKDLTGVPAGLFDFVPLTTLHCSGFAMRFKDILRNPYMWPSKPSGISGVGVRFKDILRNPDMWISKPSDIKKISMRFGDTLLEPYARPSKPSGTKEWPNEFWWCHVYGNYYYALMYRDDIVVFEHLVTEEEGYDLRPILGESFEKPSGMRHMSAFLGEKLSLNVFEPETHYPPMRLIPVYEKDLPEDFPKNLVRWIP